MNVTLDCQGYNITSGDCGILIANNDVEGGCGSVTIRNCIISSETGVAIAMESSNISLANTKVTSANGDGIHLARGTCPSPNITIANTTVNAPNGVALGFNRSLNSVLTNNSFIGHQDYAISVDDYYNPAVGPCFSVFQNNTGTDGKPILYINSARTINGADVSGLIVCNAANVTIRNTTVENSGIYLHNVTWSRVTNSTVSSTHYQAISLDRSSNNTIDDCRVNSATTAIEAINSSPENNFTDNVLVGQTGFIFQILNSNSYIIGNNITANRWVIDLDPDDYFNDSVRGNIYYLFNGTPSWSVYNITDSDEDHWADAGSDLPFSSNLGIDLWWGDVSDARPYTDIPTPGRATITAVLPSFNTSNIVAFQLNGNASLYDETVRLTTNVGAKVGSAFWEHKVSLLDNLSFSAYFSFRITDPDVEQGGGDGLVFAIQPIDPQPRRPRRGLGFAGILNAFGIEFDTHDDAGDGDPNDNHIGVDLSPNGTGSINSVLTVDVASIDASYSLKDGDVYHAWVDYNGDDHELTVRLNENNSSRPSDASLNYSVDLSQVFPQDVFIGFTSATGDAWENHDVLSFFFNNDYLSQGIDITTTSYQPAPFQVEVSALQASLAADGMSSSIIHATATDVEGNPLARIRVSFTTTAGSLNATDALTNGSGIASVLLTSSATPDVATVRSTARGGAYGEANVTFLTDSDGDSVPDSTDALNGDVGTVATDGVSSLNLMVNGTDNLTTFTGAADVAFFASSDELVNFTYNFSAGTLDLSKVSLTLTATSLIVNLSGQLQDGFYKTVYLRDANFISLCVKDAEISSIGEVSPRCDGANETVFTTCLGNSTGVTMNGVTCKEAHDIISVSNLRHSAIRGTLATQELTSGHRGGFFDTPVLNATPVVRTFSEYGVFYFNVPGNQTVFKASITSIINDGANVDLGSAQVSLKVGESKDVDLTGDGTADVSITLTEITRNTATLIFHTPRDESSDAGSQQSPVAPSSLSPQPALASAPTATQPATAQSTPQGPAAVSLQTPRADSKWVWWVLVIMSIIALVWLFWMRKQRRV
jgi:parallel beta-helix repeat protein